ncbi:MAG: two-component regulator propeller domain-containing protein [Cytophagaceae bacterium]
MYLRIFPLVALAVMYSQLCFGQWTLYYTANTGGELINNGTSIGVDNLGTVYIGTSDHGVTSFNGTDWNNYEDSTGFPNEVVTSIFVTGTTINITTNFNGLGIFSAGAWTTTDMANTSPNGLPDDETYGISFDSKGNKWIASYSGLVRDSSDGSWKTYFHNTESFYCVYADAQGNKWAGTRGHGLCKFKDGISQFYNTGNSAIPNDSVNVIVRTSDQNFWIGTDVGLAKFDGSTWTVYTTANTLGKLPGNKINGIALDNAENILLATDGGFAMFIPGTNTWKTYTASNSNLLESNVKAVAVDPNTQQIWLAMATTGIAVAAHQLTSLSSQSDHQAMLSVYPCPATDQFSLTYTLNADHPITISILDLAGHELISFSQNQSSGQHTIDFNTGSLAAGTYICRLQGSGGYSDQKLVIIK